MPTFKRYYSGSSVSRDLPPGEYSWDTVVGQTGRPFLDAELNLMQDGAEYNRSLLLAYSMSSGFLKSSNGGYQFPAASGANANKFTLTRDVAVVAGMPVVLDYTNSNVANANVISLPVPTVFGGFADARRTDFVFLEVWRALVSPSPRAYGTISINSPQTIINGDTITIDATAVGGPVVLFRAEAAPATTTEFLIGAGAASTASALAAVINDPTNGLYPSYVAARTSGTATVTVTATFGGVAGNTITLATGAPPHITLSGGTLLNGADTGNRPTQSKIYRLGNVSSSSTVALDDDLVDPVLNMESTRRVQVQYRLRTYSSQASGVNPKTQPNGFSNTGILAQGSQVAPVALYPFVPADRTTTTSNSDATQYPFEDSGLYIAGDGTSGSATALGTVDGFVYAIPLCMVFRRNDATATGGFDPLNNSNGGLPIAHANNFPNTNLPGGPFLIPSNESDRPDGLFADILVAEDLLDLRRHVSSTGIDYEAELKFQLQALLDKTLGTWQVSGSDLGMIGNGSGGDSVYPLVCDEIGRENANGGVAPSSGDTTVGNTVRNFDHVARRFAAQSVVEKVVFEVLPNGPNPTGITVTKASGVTWHEGDEIAIDFGSLNPTTLQDWTTPDVPAVGVSAFWPSGTMVTDVGMVTHDDGHTGTPIDQSVQLTTIVGIGTGVVALTLDANNAVVNEGGISGDHPVVGTMADNGSPRRIFVELEVTYPTGYGTSRTPDREVEPTGTTGYPPYDEGGAIVENDNTQRPAEMAAAWVPKPVFREGFREVVLEQQTAPAGTFITDTLVTLTGSTLRTPRRVLSATSLTANGGAATALYGDSRRLVTLTGAPSVNQTAVAVTYYSQDPVPNAGASGYQVGVYYRTHAPQTCGVQGGGVPTTLLPTELELEPLCISDNLWTGQAGKGSTEVGFPYASPLDQIAMATDHPVGSTPKEWYFSAMAEISIGDFNANTGLLSLHTLVPIDGSNSMTLGSSTAGRGTEIDAEFRAYYDYVNYGGYKPTAMAQPLTGATRHKSFTSMLARSTSDTRLFRKGEVLLVVFSRFADLDPNNSIAFTDTPNIRTAAAVYRTRNLLLTPMV